MLGGAYRRLIEGDLCAIVLGALECLLCYVARIGLTADGRRQTIDVGGVLLHQLFERTLVAGLGSPHE